MAELARIYDQTVDVKLVCDCISGVGKDEAHRKKVEISDRQIGENSNNWNRYMGLQYIYLFSIGALETLKLDMIPWKYTPFFYQYFKLCLICTEMCFVY